MAKRILAVALAVAGFIAIMLLPREATAAVGPPGAPPPVTLQPGVTYGFNYSIERADGMGLERTGTLILSFSTSGIITGRYGNGADFPTIPVTGAMKNGEFWLDIGASAGLLLHVNGIVDTDGSLSAYGFESGGLTDGSLSAYGFGSGGSNVLYKFIAVLK